MTAEAPKDIVYVVHGTNVHEWWLSLISEPGEWWLPNSKFSEAIARAFAGCEVRWHWWTGHNTHIARKAAGVDLAQEIRERCAPSARVHVVGHSHGGNIALIAANELPPKRISTIVLLANPNMALLHHEPRKRSEWLYWGDAAERADRIFNLYSPTDTVQTNLANLSHGIPEVRTWFTEGPALVVERTIDAENVENGQILWHKERGAWLERPIAHRGRSAHSAMHCEKAGAVVGHLMAGKEFPEAMREAGLKLNEVNEIEDAGHGTNIRSLRVEAMDDRPIDRFAAGLGDATPFEFHNPAQKSGVGVLLVHGFTASAAETRPLGKYIHQETGWRCAGVTLPGHGTNLDEMLRSTSQAWLRHVEDAYAALTKEVDTVFLIGVSMGACLSCLVAKRFQGDDKVRGALLLSPAFKIPATARIGSALLRPFRDSTYKGRATERYYYGKRLRSYCRVPLAKVPEMAAIGRSALTALTQLTVPVRILAGELDTTVVIPKTMEFHTAHDKVEVHWLPFSGHVLTAEPERRAVFEACVAFMTSITKA